MKAEAVDDLPFRAEGAAHEVELLAGGDHPANASP
jgi:hypothetical protein